MDKNSIWKWLILIAATVFSVIIVTPFEKKIRWGIDLKGGTSFTLQIDTEQIRRDKRLEMPEANEAQIEAEVQKVLNGAQGRALEVVRNRVDTLGIDEPVIYPGSNHRIIVQLPGADEAKRREAEERIKTAAFLTFRLVHPRNADLTRAIFDKRLAPDGYRIIQMGGQDYYAIDESFKGKRDREFREKLGRFNAPDAQHEFMLEKNEVDGAEVYSPAFVRRKHELTGDLLKDAKIDMNTMGQSVVNLTFDGRGAKRFARVTTDNTGRQLAIVLDGTLYSAPRINEPIYGGRAEISGRFTQQEAMFLANILRAGSLPAPVEIIEQTFVAPTLGQESIEGGVKAILYSGLLVGLFMIAYYRMSGLVADIALLLNLVILPFGMILAAGFLGIFAKDASGRGYIQLPVLTLPGIAGIVLTIGMAVDANILIFERIREELKAGKRLWTAVSAGYDRAFSAIFDSNITTLLSAVILFIFGSGPIRGFAVTLSAGIIVSMFTALVVTRLIFDLLVNRVEIKKLTMTALIKPTSIDFIGKRRAAAILSVIVVGGSFLWTAVNGVRNPEKVFDVDFTGGTALTFSVKERVPEKELRATLAASGLERAQVQYLHRIEDAGTPFLEVKTGVSAVDGKTPAAAITEALQQKHPAAGFTVVQTDAVGGQVGSELKRRAVWAVVLSLVGIIIYISWKFEFGFALGAIVALLHDVLFTVGMYCLLGRQISLPIIAALLTIVGFSVNDTIVIFDRIREDLKLVKNKTFREICNQSINATLSRTLLTSLTVLMSVIILLIFGGGAISDFAMAMFLGLLTGTYSTVYVATPVVLWWHKDKRPDLTAKTSTVA